MEANTAMTKIRYNVFDFGFLLIVTFVFLRPLTLVVPNDILEGYNILELFTIFFSYLFVIPLLISFKKIRVDKITFSILLYCAYVAFSFLWGSSVREVGRMTLPLIIFFYARTTLIDDQRIKIMLTVFVLGFIYPIIGSFVSILTGSASYLLVWHAGVEKTAGIVSEIHTYGHAMLFFSFLYAFFSITIGSNKTKLQAALFVLFCISAFGLYKSGVRTVYLGFVVFWGIYLLATNRKYFLILIAALICFIAINHLHLERVFWQTQNPKERTLDAASSGRISLWNYNLSVFKNDYSLDQKIFGIGLGKEGRRRISGFGEPHVVSSHNDYLSLLMMLGPLGLALYVFIFLVIMYDIFYSQIEWKLRSIFMGILFSILAMNLVSNSYIARVEMAQYFWLFMGIFYALNDNIQHHKKK